MASDRASAGRYDVHEELARGGMGVVYRAFDHTTGRTLALKRSLGEKATGAELSRSMLQREYQTLVTLRHPHIIQVYDFGVDERGPYYTMELLDGVDLRAKCPLPWREVCTYMRDVASSLALLHSRRLLHCDVTVANIRLTSVARAKLLDFGALASFGRNSVLAGTPPNMAPEVLGRDDLDQRVDLYALGASAYYALCGRHAYPSASLALLPAVWAQGRPPAPSTLVAEIPVELSELVLALLDHDRMSRPSSAAEVIDRLEAIAGLTPDQDQRVQRSYLHTAVIGRDAERANLDARLKKAIAGRGEGVLLEGVPGLGKSFLLEDLLQTARFGGARVLTVNARAHSAAFSELLREARASRSAPEATAEDTFLTLAETRPLVLAIENLQEADADSLAAYTALSTVVRRARVLLLGTVDPDHPQAQSAALRLLRERLASIELKPFDEKTTHAFVVSLFGDVTAAPRLASFLHNHAAGNPRAYTEVVQHLIDQGFIRYAEGTWVLPDELPSALELGDIVKAAFDSRIARWSPALRTFALCLSPQRRTFTFDYCQALSQGEPELEGKPLAQLLTELVREDVLIEDRGTYAFAGSRIRDVLYERLDAGQKKRLHGRLAKVLLDKVGADPSRAFEIGFHFLLAGEKRKARSHINSNVEASLMDPDLMVESVPDLLALLEQQRGAGATDEDVQFIEGMLATSGFYSDPTMQDRFGERAILHIRRTVGFELAARLSPWLGSFLAVFVGVMVAAIKSLFRTPYLVGGSFRVSMLFFAGVTVGVGAGASHRYDRRVHSWILELIDVAKGLPKLNVFRLLYDCLASGEQGFGGSYRAVQACLDDQLERLPRIPMVTKESQHQWEAGLQVAIAHNQMMRLDCKALKAIERLEEMGGKHDRVMALFLRSAYHLYRGDLVAAKRQEEQFNQMAAVVGSRWVADLMGALQFVPYHWSRDVLGLKRALHRLDKFVAIAPGLKIQREVLRAIYEGHRGRPDLALAIYASIEDQIQPFASPFWGIARSHQAECLNMLGRPADALKVCERARAHLTNEDRVYVFPYQQLERESALALAGLGRFEEAALRMDTLVAECASSDNPLIIGILHHDRARIACAARDSEGFERHACAAETAFSSTGNPALMARIKRLLEMGRGAGVVAAAHDDAQQEAISGLVNRGRANRLLAEVVQAVGAKSACLYLFLYGKAVMAAQYGEVKSVASSDVEQVIAGAARTFDGEVSEEIISTAVSRMELRDGVRVVPLVASANGEKRQVMGMLVLGECEKVGSFERLDFGMVATALVEQDEATDIV